MAGEFIHSSKICLTVTKTIAYKLLHHLVTPGILPETGLITLNQLTFKQAKHIKSDLCTARALCLIHSADSLTCQSRFFPTIQMGRKDNWFRASWQYLFVLLC